TLGSVKVFPVNWLSLRYSTALTGASITSCRGGEKTVDLSLNANTTNGSSSTRLTTSGCRRKPLVSFRADGFQKVVEPSQLRKCSENSGTATNTRIAMLRCAFSVA